MKLLSRLAAAAPLAVLMLGEPGCATHKTVVPLSNGYEVVAHPHRTFIDDPPPPTLSLQRRDKEGTVQKIWPSLYSTDTVLRGDELIFVAEKAYVQPERVTRPRLFMVKPPELPLDITDEILWRWAKANHRDFTKVLQKFAGVTPADQGDGVEVRLDFWASPVFGEVHQDWPDNGTLQLGWPEIEEIMHAVRVKGMLEKDLRWHSEYIGEKL